MSASRDTSQGIQFNFPKTSSVVTEALPPTYAQRVEAIKQNLDRLQQLHHKLHEVLEEMMNAKRRR